MNIADIRIAVADIAELRGDPEAAHAAEDDLYLAFVRYIVEGNWPIEDLQVMAAELLKTQKIEFDRWCA